MINLLLVATLLVIPLAQCIHEPDTWQPVIAGDTIFHGVKSGPPPQPSFSSIIAQGYQGASSLQGPSGGDQCEVYKVGFTQDLYFQYIQYKTEIPELKEFTLCFWTKFINHSNDHPLFSYAVDDQPRAIYAWVSNTERSSYFSLAVEGHTFYRLNYPLRLNRWYHTCQSWNGKTGEWQIWVNAERVGRGFHNRLVGHVIPAGGIAISGQEQSQLGGGFQEGKDAPKGAGGMLGEITMVQLYSVALTAGKAHRDHKHHHAHKFDHNGVPITTPPPTTTTPRSLLPTHPLLTGGQINPSVRINFAGGQPGQQPPPQPQIIPGKQFNAQFLNGQFLGSLVSQQLSQGQQRLQQQQQQPPPQPITQSFFQLQDPQQILPSGQGSSGNSFSSQAALSTSGLVHPSLVNPANVQIIDNTQLDAHQLFKREDKTGRRIKKSSIKNKRELFLAGGTIVDTDDSPAFEQSLLNGLAGIGENEPIQQVQKQKDEREPAEAEVQAVMNICSGCDEEPFDKALVFGWRNVPKKLYSGAFLIPAQPICKAF